MIFYIYQFIIDRQEAKHGNYKKRFQLSTDEATTEPTTELTTEPTTKPIKDNGRDYVANTSTGKFYYPSCSSADDIKAANRWDYHGIRDELIDMDYVPCKRCDP